MGRRQGSDAVTILTAQRPAPRYSASTVRGRLDRLRMAAWRRSKGDRNVATPAGPPTARGRGAASGPYRGPGRRACSGLSKAEFHVNAAMAPIGLSRAMRAPRRFGWRWAVQIALARAGARRRSEVFRLRPVACEARVIGERLLEPGAGRNVLGARHRRQEGCQSGQKQRRAHRPLGPKRGAGPLGHLRHDAGDGRLDLGVGQGPFPRL